MRAIVGCPLKEEKHAAVATAEAERPSTDISISVDEELYELVKVTNPVLCMMIDLSKKLQEE